MKTGYEISYTDFLYLLTNADYRQEIAPLITSWFECKVVPTTDGFTLLDAQGAEMNQQMVYDTIQADPERQYTLYQAAMTLWR
jgi:hypothetical protein